MIKYWKVWLFQKRQVGKKGNSPSIKYHVTFYLSLFCAMRPWNVAGKKTFELVGSFFAHLDYFYGYNRKETYQCIEDHDFLCNLNIINLFFTSRISANHDKWLVFYPIGEFMYLFLMFNILIYHAKNKRFEIVKLCMGCIFFLQKCASLGRGVC